MQHHPDKDRQSGSAAPSSANTSRPSIHDLYEAYNVLYDERAREEYDAELSRLARLGVQSSAAATTATPSRREARISAEVDLDAFTAHEGHDAASDEDMITFTYPCRCGSHFALTSDDLLTEELDLVECSGCSEVVRVLWRDGEEADESR